jgi:type IV pilus assembly protein PilN
MTPKRLWLRKMEEKGGTTITFEGTAATIDDVSAFMAALKTSKHFNNVELKKTTATGKGGGFRLVDFTINSGVAYGGLTAQAAQAEADAAAAKAGKGAAGGKR